MGSIRGNVVSLEHYRKKRGGQSEQTAPLRQPMLFWYPMPVWVVAPIWPVFQ